MTDKNTPPQHSPDAQGPSGQESSGQGASAGQNPDAMKSAEQAVEDILKNAADPNAAKHGLDQGIADHGIADQGFTDQGSDPLSAEELATATADIGQSDGDELGFGDIRMDSEESAGAPDLQLHEDPEALMAKLVESEEKVASHWDKLLRMQADMENQRKRAQKDVENARKFALEGIANDLLPVKDSLEMGLQAASGDDADLEKIVEGSDLTLKMLAQALEKYKIIEVDPINEKFNPELHQAMSSQPADGVEPNTVVAVLQKGYTLNDRLIRPALVMVAK